MNEAYPAHRRWRITINTVVRNHYEAVSDDSVTGGAESDRANSFFSVHDGRIVKIVEFLPEAYRAPKNRHHITG
jgi:hypothetical protein